MQPQSTILIVDDNPNDCTALQLLLMTDEYKFIFAADGTAALAVANQVRPDLLLLDVLMPNMDGFEVCQRLRANPHLAELPIIMITGLDDNVSYLRGIEVGADDFITKPFNQAELRTRIQTILRLNRYRRLMNERIKFEWVVEHTKDGYVILNQQQQLVYTNPQARLYLGLTSSNSKIIGEPFMELISQQYQGQPQAIWETWPQVDPEIPLYLIQPATATNSSFWLQVELITVPESDHETYLVRLRDVTANIVEQRLRWTFHGQISHKFKSPLTVIDTFRQLLPEEENQLSVADWQTLLPLVRSQLNTLKEDILEVFRYLNITDVVSSRQGNCSLETIFSVINKVGADLQLTHLEIQSDPYLHNNELYIPLSAKALELVLWEILDNAQKFHPNSSPEIEINIFKLNDHLCLEIFDNGITLSPYQLSQIWQPYYQAEKGFSGQIPGLGVGLSIVTAIIWSVGGTCQAYNRPNGSGIVVELTVPILGGNQ